ncbi:MAG TPA: nuclear transport factor 2 family protein [Pyrinomonadaceae bacterium]|jgi:ketosteroid isomerase-like protein
MKKLFISVALMMLLGALAFGQKMTVEQTIMNIEQEMASAVIKSDTTVFEKYFADDGSFSDPMGMMMTKAELIAQFKSGDLKIESSKVDGMKVRTYGNTAIATYTTTDKGKYKNQDISGQARWIDVFVKTNGKWKLVAAQGTMIMKQ